MFLLQKARPRLTQLPTKTPCSHCRSIHFYYSNCVHTTYHLSHISSHRWTESWYYNCYDGNTITRGARCNSRQDVWREGGFFWSLNPAAWARALKANMYSSKYQYMQISVLFQSARTMAEREVLIDYSFVPGRGQVVRIRGTPVRSYSFLWWVCVLEQLQRHTVERDWLEWTKSCSYTRNQT